MSLHDYLLSLKRHPIVKGTMILTLTGIITRILGFILRIFLSREIGAEGMGIYQLAFPVFFLLHAAASSGIEAAISKCVSAYCPGQSSRTPFAFLLCGILCSMCICIPGAILIYSLAEEISTFLLKEPACKSMLQVLAVTAPLSCIHGCICHYYYGQNKSGVPAFSQFLEQAARIAATLLLWLVMTREGKPFSPFHAALAMALGEGITVLICVMCLRWERDSFSLQRFLSLADRSCRNDVSKPLLRFAYPMTINRLLVTALQSIEAVAIPFYLRFYGYSQSEALSTYGALTGMALPFIMIPTTLTNALAVMLLPSVSSAQAQKDYQKIRSTARTNISFCFLMGCGFTLFFLLFGQTLGILFYDSRQAGFYLCVLAWICPFMYAASAMNSVLNGLGKMRITLYNSIISMLLRLGFILAGVPRFGMNAYLTGLLTSQLLLCGLHLAAIKRALPAKDTR